MREPVLFLPSLAVQRTEISTIMRRGPSKPTVANIAPIRSAYAADQPNLVRPIDSKTCISFAPHQAVDLFIKHESIDLSITKISSKMLGHCSKCVECLWNSLSICVCDPTFAFVVASPKDHVPFLSTCDPVNNKRSTPLDAKWY